MTRSTGQTVALEQLHRVAKTKASSLELISVTEPANAGDALIVDIKIDCSRYQRTDDGLLLRVREHFCIRVPSLFPFKHPSVTVPHTRFDGFPHVQWRRTLCLYQSPQVEWNPSDGMFGFLKRLDEWIAQGAINQLDPAGGPIHPPAVYPEAKRRIVTKADTPDVGDQNWVGFADLVEISEYRSDLIGWYELIDPNVPDTAVPAILASEPFPFEYPITVIDTIERLAGIGIDRRSLISCLQLGAFRTPDGKPMYLVIGTPMRGVSGDPESMHQHLAVWEIDSEATDSLRLSVRAEQLISRVQDEDLPGLLQLAADIRETFDTWAKSARTKWCRILEAREEIVQRRDADSAMTWFNGKKVVIWGCGALGSVVAEAVARAGASEIILRDNGVVEPGLLHRQNFTDGNIAYTKASCLASRLQRISPKATISHVFEDVITGVISSTDWTEGADVIIDATASNQVQCYLETKWREAKQSAAIASLAINADSDCGIVALSFADHSGGPYDVFRRIGLSTKNRIHLKAFADEFWPEEPAELFQPEPGCSDPTFRGSYADTASLALRMLNMVAEDLANKTDNFSGRGHLVSHSKKCASQQDFKYVKDHSIPLAGRNSEVRISENSWREMNAWINRSARLASPDVETGGLLFGEFDEAADVIWINEILGPPPDSSASAEYFECGIVGTAEVNREAKRRSRGSVSYVGTWHTHPTSAPNPSVTDYAGMAQILAEQDLSVAQQLLIIVGQTTSRPIVGAHMFRSDSIVLDNDIPVAAVDRSSGQKILKPPRTRAKLGIALSGGGSRAIAFHLGCARALNDLGLLANVEAMSSVSGGSIFTALYAYSNEDFEQFDERVVAVLKRGFSKRMLRAVLASSLSIRILVTNLSAGIAALAVAFVKPVLSVVASIFGFRRRQRPDWIDRLRPPLRRRYSITNALETAINEQIGDKKITEPTRDNIDVVFNACELRTGTAFRFSNRGSRCWRFGWLKENDVTVGRAVAASAAYPAILPAFDETFEFNQSEASVVTKSRVVVTDGGVYDNLGVSPLEPNADARYKIINSTPNIIICCDAGAGQFSDHAVPYGWPSRMSRSFETTFRKVQDATKARLHKLAEHGDIDAFVYSFLGQMDDALPCAPAELVSRDEVVSYPTDFSPMPDKSIQDIAARGEVLTRYLVKTYLADI